MKKTPMRKCTGCGEMKDKKEMIRVIRNDEGKLELDMTGRKNGRGAYICNDIECLRKARKNKGLERSFKMPVPPEVYEQIEKEFIESEQQKA
ncbi:MAG: YlxR family protein [Lachnospiraceae bacterium]|jgi:predicted RNA-binding protein YlxR (DUF448 family)|nr:YlxR family protein [Lachnospiraceae bacterium]